MYILHEIFIASVYFWEENPNKTEWKNPTFGEENIKIFTLGT